MRQRKDAGSSPARWTEATTVGPVGRGIRLMRSLFRGLVVCSLVPGVGAVGGHTGAKQAATPSPRAAARLRHRPPPRCTSGRRCLIFGACFAHRSRWWLPRKQAGCRTAARIAWAVLEHGLACLACPPRSGGTVGTSKAPARGCRRPAVGALRCAAPPAWRHAPAAGLCSFPKLAGCARYTSAPGKSAIAICNPAGHEKSGMKACTQGIIQRAPRGVPPALRRPPPARSHAPYR